MQYRILVVEDDPVIAGAVRELLCQWGYDARCTADFRDVLGQVRETEPHLVILDVYLPYYNGYHWCTEIRRFSQVPILFLSSAGDNMNQVMAMNMGGDDFVAKPFSPELLTAKVQALLRRSYAFVQASSALEHRGAVLRAEDACLHRNGERLELTRNEYRILHTLLSGKGKIVSRDALIRSLWETDSYVDENTLTVNITRLRKKLTGFGLPDFITTKKGLGYLIDREEPEAQS